MVEIIDHCKKKNTACVWNTYCKSTLGPLSHAELVLFQPQRRVSAALIPPFKLLLTASQSDSIEAWRGKPSRRRVASQMCAFFPLCLSSAVLPLCLYLSCLDAHVRTESVCRRRHRVPSRRHKHTCCPSNR